MAPISRTRPGAFGELTRWIAMIVLLGGLAWLPRTSALFFALCAGSHVDWEYADLNHDGYVSVIEAGYACNVDSRPVRRNGRMCTEYYNRVDWRPVQEVCD